MQIRKRLVTAQDHQKKYADKRRKPLEFKVEDRVLLKVPPWKGVVRFGKKGKLAPRYVGPFEIVEHVGPVAYHLRLPQELSCVHDVFHVSNLKKCLAESDVQVPLEEIKVDDKLYFVEEPVEIMDRQVKKLKRSWILIVKVCWDSHRGAEFTWEQEDQFKAKKTRVQSKEHFDSLIAQINAKSVENSDLNVQLQEKVFAITTLKNKLRKLKGKNVVNTAVSKPNATLAPGMFKLDIEPISPRLKNNRDAHEVYIKKTIEYTDTLRGFVERARTQYPSEPLLEYACMFTKHVQEFPLTI
ncbi:hypothetical protein Tco_0219125 [Tanacetum coccineum]